MRVGGSLLVLGTLLVLSLPHAVAADAGATGSGPSLELYAHWPGSLAQGMEEPIELTPLYPSGEPDLSQGPAAPGASAAGTLPTFTYTLINPDGSRGPFGDVELDPARPVVATFFLSADETVWPTAAGEPPEDVDYGVVPAVTVNATLRVGDRVVATASETHDLVSLPDPVGAAVQAYALALQPDTATIPAGRGLSVELTVHQAVPGDQRVMQPGFNVHTGQDYPTGVVLPLADDPALDGGRGDPSGLGLDIDRETQRTAALGVLVGALAVAAAALVKIVWDLRR